MLMVVNGNTQPKLEIVRGALVDEVHQQFSPWVAQVCRLLTYCSISI